MKITLTHDADRPDVTGDVVAVKDGYGRNYLIPRGYAVRRMKGGQKQIGQVTKAHRCRAIQSLDEVGAIQEALQANVLKIVKPAEENGRLFGSVTSAEIAEAALAATGKKVGHHMIVLASPIKSTGSYKAATRPRDDVVATIPIEVMVEKKRKK